MVLSTERRTLMNTQDLIEEYLLDKKSRVKLSILQFLADNPFYITREYLAEHFEMCYQLRLTIILFVKIKKKPLK